VGTDILMQFEVFPTIELEPDVNVDDITRFVKENGSSCSAAVSQMRPKVKYAKFFVSDPRECKLADSATANG